MIPPQIIVVSEIIQEYWRMFMGTTIRPEISKKKKYWISKHRFYELKHFCLQYNEWKRELTEMSWYSSESIVEFEPSSNVKESGLEQTAERRMELEQRIDILEKALRESCGNYWKLMLKAVTEEISYECLSASYTMPCCKDIWYDAYRRFFWVLDSSRK